MNSKNFNQFLLTSIQNQSFKALKIENLDSQTDV